MIGKKKEYAELQAMLALVLQELKTVYSNRSSDEYKQAGDITKLTSYNRIEERLADLTALSGFNKNNVSELKSLFSTLHRPIFKQMVVEYLQEPNEQNIFYTAIYTCGYRVLIGEIARIFASTVADKKGMRYYKPDKLSREASMDKFIKLFNIALDDAINDFVKLRKNAEIHQEAVSGAGDMFASMWGDVKFIGKNILKTLLKIPAGIVTGKVNPIALIGTVMSTSYTMKVRKFDEICTHYEEAKKAMEEYQKLPRDKQNAAIIEKYEKLIDKYNIKMKNMAAKIEHYDQRAIAEAETKLNMKKKKMETEASKKQKDNTNNTSNDDDFDF